jgi:aminoglycoside phosphotransferase (APT) family kinase protein/RimJ/RimL family protein N-acetyltransferase
VDGAAVAGAAGRDDDGRGDADGDDVHDGQLTVTAATVRALVAEQFPRWAGLAVRAVDSPGTVNAIFRIGDRLAARFPLVAGDGATVRAQLAREAAAAGELAGRTRFATPEPGALGDPGPGYPLPWSVQTWLPGVTADHEDPAASAGFAGDLAEFIGAARAMDVGGREFDGAGRGGELGSHDDWVQLCLERSEGLLDVPRLRALWRVMRELPRGADPDAMSHRDLIPGNVLVSGRGGDARLAGVLDVGGLGPADPALDLVAGWHLLADGPRRVFRQALGSDDAEWARGRAWAFEQAIGLVWYYLDSNPPMSALGRRTLGRIVRDQAGDGVAGDGVEIAVADPREAVARECLRAYFEELGRRFDDGFDPALSIPAEDAELTWPAGLLLVATVDGEPAGCGALKFHPEDGIAEVKRMWVSPTVRGRGLGRRLLDELENQAARHGVRRLRLETNRNLTEAIALYRGAGYREVAAFNDEAYAHHWFEKPVSGGR